MFESSGQVSHYLVSNMITNNWLTITSFLLLSSLLAIGYGWGIKKQILPLRSLMNFSEGQWKFMRIWVKVALILGIIFPIILLAIFWYQPEMHQFWGVYLLIVAIQLISEVALSNYFVKSVVVPIGTVYTIFRLWELIEAWQNFSFSALWLYLFVLIFSFWTANLIMLIFMAIPSIFPEK